MVKEERVLVRRVMKVEAEVQEILKRVFQVKWFKPKQEDALRLLVLAQWQEKYRVSIEWILRHLVPIWRASFTKYEQSGGIGVSISTLTGKKSEAILQERLKKEFPNQENIAGWKSQEQSRQWAKVWDHRVIKEDWTNPSKTVREYQKKMTVERRYLRKFQHEQQKRKYRGNPWID